MAERATEVQRTAQRRIVGVVVGSGVLTRGGLALWRDSDADARKVSAGELSADLDILGVPHRVVTAFGPPRKMDMVKVRRRGQEVRVAFGDLPELVRWMPALGEAVGQLPEDAPGFDFVYFEPRVAGMATVSFSAFAANWPSWTGRQAGQMGLLCADCRFDLRDGGDESRLPYNIPGQRNRRRLYCGQCCNDGIDELARLAAR